MVYASDAASTAYQFPLVDAKLSNGPNGEVVCEVPLDGTQYDLRNGAVLKWCPKCVVWRGGAHGLALHVHCGCAVDLQLTCCMLLPQCALNTHLPLRAARGGQNLHHQPPGSIPRGWQHRLQL